MKRNATPIGKRRGVALLLVMVGLVVCTLLTAGFLSTQGTSIAIARNERDAEQCRMLAQTGIDLCFAQIRALDAARTTADQPGWREKMSPGLWISNYAVGSGTVTVAAAAGAAGSSTPFTADYHQPIVLTSTGFANNRQFTLTATITPTGGGEVFRGGNYFSGAVVVGSGQIAVVDSYNSTNGKYTNSDHNVSVWSDSSSNNGISVALGSTLDGSILAGPTAILSQVLNLLGTLLGGTNIPVVHAAEPRDPGIVIPPNNTGLTSQGSFNTVGNLSVGIYDVINVAATAGSAGNFYTGLYVDKGNFNVAATGAVSIQGNTVLYVMGNLVLAPNSSITVSDGCSLTLYVAGSINITQATVSAAGTNPLPANVQILGLPSCNSVKIMNGASFTGVVYAPQASVLAKNSTATPSVMQGAVVAHDFTLSNTSKFHYDEATKNVKVGNISGGTAPPGAADYTIAVH